MDGGWIGGWLVFFKFNDRSEPINSTCLGMPEEVGAVWSRQKYLPYYGQTESLLIMEGEFLGS